MLGGEGPRCSILVPLCQNFYKWVLSAVPANLHEATQRDPEQWPKALAQSSFTVTELLAAAPLSQVAFQGTSACFP